MMNIKKQVIIGLGICLLWLMYAQAAEHGKISLKIIEGFLTIKGTWTIALWEIWYTMVPQEITAIVSPEMFSLQDKAGSCSGYYTTLQASNLTNGANTIANQNVFFKTAINPIYIQGSINNHVFFWDSIQNKRWSLEKPVTYFYRAKNQWCHIIGEYTDNPELKVTIPALQSTGNYKGKLYYLLIDKRDF